MRIYLNMRLIGPLILIIYLVFRVNSQPNITSELFLFNLLPISVIAAITTSRVPDDRIARRSTMSAIALWTTGSILSSIDSFYSTNFSLFSQICYLLFYPALFLGLNRAINSESRNARLEFIDIASLAIGGSTLLSIFLIHPLQSALDGSSTDIFFSIIYPVADLVLLIYVTSLSIKQGLSKRVTFILAGTLIYTGADLYYLWQTSIDHYSFGSLSDLFWLISFIFFGWSFHFPADENREDRAFNPAVSIVTALASALIIVVVIVDPQYFPRFAIIPAVASLSLAFARLVFAISDAKRMSDEMILARTDELTGLANRRKFLSSFDQFIKSEGSLLILDLDGFKPVNDQLGHEIGDQLLRQVAKRFERSLGKEALLARLGGDEFGVLVPGHDGLEVAQALRATLTYPFNVAGHEIQLDVSIGEAFNDPQDFRELPPLLKRADEAMYEAKRTKSGVFRWSAPIMRSTS